MLLNEPKGNHTKEGLMLKRNSNVESNMIKELTNRKRLSQKRLSKLFIKLNKIRLKNRILLLKTHIGRI